MSFKHLLDRCVSVTGTEADLTWVPLDALLASGADPWMGVPMWIAGTAPAMARRGRDCPQGTKPAC